MRPVTEIFLLFIIASVVLFPQEKKQIEAKQNELSSLKKEINILESELKSKTKKEQESYNAYENYSRQNYIINKIIINLHQEEKIKEEEINNNIAHISALENEIKKLKENYARYVKAIYKNGKTSELAALFDARSIEQALVRYKYLERFSASRRNDLFRLKNSKQRLEFAKIQLEEEKREKEYLAEQKSIEEAQLKKKVVESKKILSTIRNDKAELKKEIDAKRSAETKIKNLITRLIEEDARRKKEEAIRLAKLEKLEKERTAKTTASITTGKKSVKEPVPEYNINLSSAGFASFAALKGKLNWPVAGGKIIRKFGENRNTKLNTVTLNYGVDILAKSDLNVKSVAEGVVSAIDWIPGYGSIIIITHKDDYRTVYSHLSEIHVKEGDKVKMGNVIAKVGESLEGNILHFEIWNSRSNQNPEVWFASR